MHSFKQANKMSQKNIYDKLLYISNTKYSLQYNAELF